jgi:hypothetical protein
VAQREKPPPYLSADAVPQSIKQSTTRFAESLYQDICSLPGYADHVGQILLAESRDKSHFTGLA